MRRTAAKASSARKATRKPSAGKRPEPVQTAAEPTLRTEEFIAVTGLPCAYVVGLIAQGTIDAALVPQDDGIRIRPVGLPMLLLTDEIAGLVVEGRLTALGAAHVLSDLQPQLPQLWRGALAGRSTAIALIPKVNGRPVRIDLEFLRRAVERWRSAQAAQ